MKNPYHSLNLIQNPFGEISPAKRAKLACVDLELINDLCQLLNQNNIILQFVADHGRGKSTHLLNLHAHLTKQLAKEIAYTQLGDSRTIVWHNQKIYFVDSIEHLNLFQRIRLYKKYPKLAVTTHKNLSHEMRLVGCRVHSIEIKQTDLGRLQKIFNTRVENAIFNDNFAVAYPSAAVIQILQVYCGDDIRAMESILYDIYYLLGQRHTQNKPLHSLLQTTLKSQAVNHNPSAISSANATFNIASKVITDMGNKVLHYQKYIKSDKE